MVNKKKLSVLVLTMIACLTLLCACDNTSASVSNVINDNTKDAYDDSDSHIGWDEAKSHEGETVTVVGKVVGTKYARDTNGEPTFLDIGLDYPDPDRFSVVIWGDSRDNFSVEPESYYLNKTVAVTGDLYLREGVANMKIDDESDIKILK